MRAWHMQSHCGTCMKTGIIGLPRAGKTSLFNILTKAKLEDRGFSHPREAYVPESASISCSMPAPGLRRAPAARSAWKERNTLCRTETPCTFGTADKRC